MMMMMMEEKPDGGIWRVDDDFYLNAHDFQIDSLLFSFSLIFFLFLFFWLLVEFIFLSFFFFLSSLCKTRKREGTVGSKRPHRRRSAREDDSWVHVSVGPTTNRYVVYVWLPLLSQHSTARDGTARYLLSLMSKSPGPRREGWWDPRAMTTYHFVDGNRGLWSQHASEQVRGLSFLASHLSLPPWRRRHAARAVTVRWDCSQHRCRSADTDVTFTWYTKSKRRRPSSTWHHVTFSIGVDCYGNRPTDSILDSSGNCQERPESSCLGVPKEGKYVKCGKDKRPRLCAAFLPESLVSFSGIQSGLRVI